MASRVLPGMVLYAIREVDLKFSIRTLHIEAFNHLLRCLPHHRTEPERHRPLSYEQRDQAHLLCPTEFFAISRFMLSTQPAALR